MDFISAIELSFGRRFSTDAISKMLDRATFPDLVLCLRQGEQITDAGFLSKTNVGLQKGVKFQTAAKRIMEGERRDRENGVTLRNKKERGGEGKEGVLSVGERGKVSCADIQKFYFPIVLLNGEKDPKLYGEITAVTRECKPDIPASLI